MLLLVNQVKEKDSFPSHLILVLKVNILNKHSQSWSDTNYQGLNPFKITEWDTHCYQNELIRLKWHQRSVKIWLQNSAYQCYTHFYRNWVSISLKLGVWNCFKKFDGEGLGTVVSWGSGLVIYWPALRPGIQRPLSRPSVIFPES